MRTAFPLAAFGPGLLAGWHAPGEPLARAQGLASQILDANPLLCLDGEAFRALCFG